MTLRKSSPGSNALLNRYRVRNARRSDCVVNVICVTPHCTTLAFRASEHYDARSIENKLSKMHLLLTSG